MKINANQNTARANATQPPAVKPVKTARTDQLEATTTLQLNAAVDNLAAARADAVNRAKALIADPNYPNPATVKQVARVLADHWSPPPTDAKTSAD